MKKVFWENPYLNSLETKVAEVKGNKVLLEETIAFSFSGGQESDHGSIDGYSILDSELSGKLIYYTLDDDHHLKVGDPVTLSIDWRRRYRLMRYHFAAELILELTLRKLTIIKIGAHIAENKARIDFLYDTNISHIFDDILAEYQTIIQRNEKIHTGYLDKENQRRYWEIIGFSKIPCGGTHVKSTKEVGLVKLKRVNIGRGKERIEITLLDGIGAEMPPLDA